MSIHSFMAALTAALTAVSLTACSASSSTASTSIITASPAASAVTAAAKTASTASIDSADLFTDRDMEQTADTSGATYETLTDGQDITITAAGVYVFSGTAKDVTITVNADDTAKVQIVLDGASITNSDAPAIYVVKADKVFVTTTATENTLAVTGTFTADGSTEADAVIFAKDDLVLNGLGTLTITSSANGVSAKDDLTITGGTYILTSKEDAFEAHDSIAIAGGSFTITAGKDAFHSEYSKDDTVGSIYIADGTFTISAGDDGIQGTTITEIDGGTFSIQSSEGIEGTSVVINGGTIDISASDDGINAASKSSAYPVTITINGGDITIVMGSGDTDAVDANGSIYVNGGTMDITAQSAFDYDVSGELNGGTVTVNGSPITALTNSVMGGGMKGGAGTMHGRS